MKLTPTGFVKKWGDRFADNDNFIISARDLREFSVDVNDTFGVTVATVPYYVAGTTYAKDFLVRYTPVNGQEAFYYSLNAGKLTAPGPGNLVDWKVVPGPVLPTDLSQSLTLSQAQGLDQAGVVAGREYLIDCGPDVNGNQQTLTVRGLANDFFDVEGTLEVNGVRTAVTDFKVQAGTWQVKQYATVTTAQLVAVATTLPPTVTRTANYILALMDAGCLVPVLSSSGVTVTVPTHAAVAFPLGTTLYIAQDGTGTVTIAPAPNVVVQTADGYKVAGQWLEVALHKRDLNTWVLKGGVA